MDLPIEQIDSLLSLIIQAKKEANSRGVPVEHLDAVSSAWAVIKWLRHGENDNTHSNIHQRKAIGLPETFVEWAARFNIKNHYDRFVVIAAYLYENKNIQAVNINYVTQMYEKARWAKPKNFADVFAKAADKVYFAEAEGIEPEDNLKMWQLTHTGYSYFQGLHMEGVINE